MSNFLKASREEIKLQLNSVLMINREDVHIYEHIPARIAAPCFVISPGSPYVEQGNSFCDFAVRYEVLALSGVASNEVETDNLDHFLAEALDALDTWHIESVEQPSQYELNGAAYLGAKINLLADKSL